MSQERVVHGGYGSRQKPSVQELTFRLEAARQAEAAACSRYTKLRGKVLAWAESRGLENEGAHLHELLREVGRWPARETRTPEEVAMDSLTFLGAHGRQR